MKHYMVYYSWTSADDNGVVYWYAGPDEATADKLADYLLKISNSDWTVTTTVMQIQMSLCESPSFKEYCANE